MGCSALHTQVHFLQQIQAVPLKSITASQLLAGNGLGLSSVVEELGCAPEAVWYHRSRWQSPSSLLIHSLAGLSKRQKNCHEKSVPGPRPPAPWIPFPWAGMLLPAVQPLMGRERAAPCFHLPDRKPQVQSNPQTASGPGSGSSAPERTSFSSSLPLLPAPWESCTLVHGDQEQMLPCTGSPPLPLKQICSSLVSDPELSPSLAGGHC